MTDREIVILGAGISGLSIAYYLKKGYRIYEKESETGGLCRSTEVEGFVFDHGAHLLHFRESYTRELVKKLLNGNLTAYKRNSYVYFRGRYIPYPFQAHLRYLPWTISRECLIGLIKSRYSRKNEKIENFSDWAEHHFGKGISKYFFLPYNRKFWRVFPQELDFKWAERFVPVPTTGEIFRGVLGRNTKQYGYNPTFYYPKQGGINVLPNAFLEEVGEVLVNKEAESIDIERRSVHFKDGETASYRYLVSTIPLPKLLKLIASLPPEMIRYSNLLRCTSIFNLNLGVREKGIDNIHWVYFPEEEYTFFRAGFLSNFSTSHPPNCSALYAEVAYSKEEEVNEEELADRVIEDLVQLQLIKDKKNIIARKIVNIPYGYTIPQMNSRKAVEALLKFLEVHNILSCGRYGSWTYMSVEDCILEGKNIAERLKLHQ